MQSSLAWVDQRTPQHFSITPVDRLPTAACTWRQHEINWKNRTQYNTYSWFLFPSSFISKILLTPQLTVLFNTCVNGICLNQLPYRINHRTNYLQLTVFYLLFLAMGHFGQLVFYLLFSVQYTPTMVWTWLGQGCYLLYRQSCMAHQHGFPLL